MHAVSYLWTVKALIVDGIHMDATDETKNEVIRMTAFQSFSLPFDRTMGDSSKSIGGWDRDANGDSGYRRSGGSSPDRLLLIGDSSNDGNRPNP